MKLVINHLIVMYTCKMYIVYETTNRKLIYENDYNSSFNYLEVTGISLSYPDLNVIILFPHVPQSASLNTASHSREIRGK